MTPQMPSAVRRLSHRVCARLEICGFVWHRRPWYDVRLWIVGGPISRVTAVAVKWWKRERSLRYDIHENRPWRRVAMVYRHADIDGATVLNGHIYGSTDVQTQVWYSDAQRWQSWEASAALTAPPHGTMARFGYSRKSKSSCTQTDILGKKWKIG